MIGQTISHYKIIEKIGQGRMGVVYRAEDTNLSRDVAIKVLPEQFTQDPQRLARFEREAKLLASLNHPNIAAIYGLEEADGVRFLSMELVPGETLADLLTKGPVPVEMTLELCRQIAEGVEAAHEKGVIHRDLKPANVKVTPEGKVKILDFGLAKAFESETPAADISQSPTLTEEMTRAGVILGTAAYMSPEQARGEEVDKRTDIFAFGCLLYELLTGKRTFAGKTVTDTLAKVLEGVPDWKALPKNTPWRIQELLQRCLTKDPDDRLLNVGEARIQIKKTLEKPATELPTGTAGAAQPVQRSWGMTAGLVLLGAVVAGLAVWLLLQPSASEQSLNRFVITPSPPVVLVSANSKEVAISPDGRQLVYMGDAEEGRQLYLRSLDEFEDRPIPGTANPGGIVFFSSDGEHIGFFAGGKLKKISLAGGSPITLCDVPLSLRTGDWFEDTIVFTATLESGQGLYRMSAAGGEPEMLATPNLDEGESGYSLPDFLPDGKNLLFTIRVNTGFQTALLSLETRERKVVLENARQARYLSTGHLVYEQSRTGNLMAAPFDLAALEVTGDSVPVVQGVRQTPNSYVDYAISDNGTLVYVPGQAVFEHSLVWVDRRGVETPVTQEKREYGSSHISPDGKQVVFSLHQGGSPHSVWTYDFGLDSLSRLTFEGTIAGAAVWSPDGKWIAYQSNPDGKRNLYRQTADRSGQPERLTTSENTQMAMSWSPDGRFLAFHESGRPGWSIGILEIDGDSEPQHLIDSTANECCARFSPDGKWIAYVSDELGRDQVYVRPYPEPDVKFLISGEEGGGEPVWSPDGLELFYRNGSSMMAVAVQKEPRFTAGKPTVLFEGRYRGLSSAPRGYQYYDISPDGRQFLMVKLDQASSTINVVLNWSEELKRLVPNN